MSSSRWLLFLVLVSGVALGVGCSGEESDREDGAPTPRSEPPPVPRDPVVEFAEAAVPPPRDYAASGIRRAAAKEGAFRDIPRGSAENLEALLKSFKEALEAAAAKPGRMRTNPAGESYAPSVAEFVVAEHAVRIRKALAGGSPGEISHAWRAAGFTGSEVTFKTYREVIVKVFGTGFVPCIEPQVGRFVVPD